MIPAAGSGGRKRETDVREVFSAIRYIQRTGCQWRQLPKDFPPFTTVYRYFWDWSRYGVLDRIHQALIEKCRQAAGREADPTAAIIDTQVAKATEKGGLDRSGRLRCGQENQRHRAQRDRRHRRPPARNPGDPGQYPGPRLRRRFDRESAAQVSAARQNIRGRRLCRAQLANAISALPVALEIVKRTDKDGGFKIIRRRWVIERTFSWLRRNRRLMAHYEAHATTAVAFIELALIALMLKRLTAAHP